MKKVTLPYQIGYNCPKLATHYKDHLLKHHSVGTRIDQGDYTKPRHKGGFGVEDRGY